MCKQDGGDDDSFAFAFTLLLENYKMWLLGFIFLFGVYWVMPIELLDLVDYWQGQFGRNRIKSST